MKLKNTMLALAIAMASSTGFANDSTTVDDSKIVEELKELKKIIGDGTENDDGLLTAFKNLYTEVYGELVPNSEPVRTVGGLFNSVNELYTTLYGNEDLEDIPEEDKNLAYWLQLMKKLNELKGLSQLHKI